MNLALFDFDGTITHGDSWTPFVRRAATIPRLVCSVVLLPVLAGYKFKLISGATARPIFAMLAFCGRSEAAIRLAGSQYAAEVLPATIRSVALARIQWHQDQGDLVLVVSGSLDVYLRPWCAGLGVDVICTELASRKGVLTGRYRQGDCTGKRKVDRLRERLRLSAFETIYAYGDSEDDDELLSVAHRRFRDWSEVT